MLDSNLSWYLWTAFWVMAGLAGVFPAILSPMTFDAPGSTSNRYSIGFALSIGVFPLFCLSGAVLPWIFRHGSFAKWLFLVPLADIAFIAYFI